MWGEEKEREERVEWRRPPPFLSCEEAPSINSGSRHTAHNQYSFRKKAIKTCVQEFLGFPNSKRFVDFCCGQNNRRPIVRKPILPRIFAIRSENRPGIFSFWVGSQDMPRIKINLQRQRYGGTMVSKKECRPAGNELLVNRWLTAFFQPHRFT